MANTPVTREQLLTNFRQLPVAVTANNGAMIIGPDYAFHAPSGAGDIGQYTGAALTGAWPGLGTGEVVDLSSVTALITSGIVKYYADTDTTPDATEGTQYSALTPNQIIHNAGATVWTGSGFSGFLNAPVAIGDYILLDDKVGNTLQTTVIGFGYISGIPKILILKDSLPSTLQGSGTKFFDVTVGQITDVSVPFSAISGTLTTVTIAASLTTITPRLGAAYPVIGGTLFDGTVLSETSVTYKALASGIVNTVTTVSVVADLPTYFTGFTDPSSGLGFAVYRALSPVVVNTAPVPVKFVAVSADTLGAYTTAANLIRYRNDFSTLAILSSDPSIVAVFKALVDFRNANNLSTEFFVSEPIPSQVQVGTSTIASIDATLTPGQERTFHVASGSPFASAVTGDTILWFSGGVYIPFVIQSVISAQAASTTTAVPGAPYTNQTIQVWHNQTAASRAAAFITAAQGFGDSAINFLFPDTLYWNGTLVSSTLLSAALAGMRSYTAPQQALTHADLEAGWDVGPTTASMAGYIPQMAAGGVFCLGIDDNLLSAILQAVTTDPSTPQTAFEVYVANVQFAAAYIIRQLNQFVGIYRTTPNLLNVLQNAAQAAVVALQSASIQNVQSIGPIITSGTIGAPYYDLNNGGTVIVPVTLVINGVLTVVQALSIQVVQS